MFSSILSHIKNSWNYSTTVSHPQKQDSSRKKDKLHCRDNGQCSKSYEPRTWISWADYVVNPGNTGNPIFWGTDLDDPGLGETDIDAICAPVKWGSGGSNSCATDCFKQFDDDFVRLTSDSIRYTRNSSGLRTPSFPKDLLHITVPSLSLRDIKLDRDTRGNVKVLGRGTYGTVYLATLKDFEGPVVVKKVSLSAMSRNDVMNEARIMIHLESTGIIPLLLGLADCNSSTLCLIQEFCAQGITLKHLINHLFFSFTQHQWLTICYEMTLGLLAIHEHKVCHNDVKADNVLVNIKGFEMKIYFIDFGLSTFKRSSRSDLSPAYLKNFRYIAPEVRLCGPTSPASDIYSLGYLFLKISEKGLGVLRAVSDKCLDEEAKKRPCAVVVALHLEDLLEDCEDWGKEIT